jgi:HlyD family secretion protein
MKGKLIISGAVVLVLVVVSYFTFSRGGTPQYNFRFDQVSKGDITTTVMATGNINAVVSVDVGTQVSGIISKLYADFNSIVKEGQVIAQIDSTFLVQAVHDAEANLARAQSQLAESKRVLDREKVLVAKGLDMQINLDAALTTFESNDAALKQANASLERAKINLAYSTIYAPIDGVVINRQVNVGQTVAASFSSPTLYTIVNDLRKMQVLATIGEVDIGGISVGQQATFTVDAYPDETFKGIVSQIRLAPVTVQNVVNYTVVIAVNNDRLKLMPGMTANVNVLVASANDVLRVPNMALRFQPPGGLIDTTGAASTNGRRFSQATGDSGGSENGSGHRGGAQPGMRRRLQDPTSAVPDSAASIVQVAARPAEQTKFGIVQTFPEFEKRTDAPLAGRGRVWVVSPAGKLKAMPVVTGITDGKYTEVTSHVLNPGDQVVLGVINSTATNGTQTRSPLTGGGQRGIPGVPH